MNNEIKEILAYFEKYVKTTYMHDSEPMLNWKDLKIVLDYITNLQQELQRKDNIINVIKEELSKDFCTYVCKNRTYGKTFKAGTEVYKEHLLYKIKELETGRSDE